jgi:hypothetical protein
LKQLTSASLSLQEVADSIVDLVELPAGDRPLRVTVGLPVASWGGFNYFSAQLQKDVLNWAGNASLATFKPHPNLDLLAFAHAESGSKDQNRADMTRWVRLTDTKKEQPLELADVS